MPERLKELSDRATPGEMKQPDWGSGLRAGKTLIGMMSPVPEGNGKANGAYLCQLWNDHRAGRLHDDTALATAVARARREALEEAAGIAESQIDQPDPYSSNAELARADTLNAGLRALASDLRALAATPPEARQTETGDDRATVLLGVIEAARAEVAFAAADEADGTATQQTRRVRLKSITAALHGVGDVQARRALGLLASPAIGNLEGESRS